MHWSSALCNTLTNVCVSYSAFLCLEGPCQLSPQLEPEDPSNPHLPLCCYAGSWLWRLGHTVWSVTLAPAQLLESLQSAKCTAGPLGAQNKYLLIKGKQMTFNTVSPIAGPGTGAAAHHLPQQPTSSCQARAWAATASRCSGWEAGGNQKMTTKERHCSGHEKPMTISEAFDLLGETEYVPHTWCLLPARHSQAATHAKR